MIRRWGFAFVVVVPSVGVWAACVGDDPLLSSTRGIQGEPCFENGTCLSTLVCMGGICDVDRDAAASSTSSGSSGSSSGNTSSSSGSASSSGNTSSSSGTVGDAGGDQHDLCGDVSNADHLICPAEPKDDDCDRVGGAGVERNCCPGKGCQQGGTCPDATNPFPCLSGEHCAGVTRCCISGTLVAQSVQECGPIQELKLDTPGTRSACSPTSAACFAGTLELCSLGGGATKTCAAGKTCAGRVLRLPSPVGTGTYTRIVHVCVP